MGGGRGLRMVQSRSRGHDPGEKILTFVKF